MRVALGGAAVMNLVVCFWGTLFAVEDQQTAPIEAEVFYVATTGNDAWSGRLSAPNDEKTDGPFASLSRARDAVRKQRAQNGLPKGATVFVRGGVYVMPATLELTPEDSGTAEAPIVCRAFQGEQPVLTGGRAIERFVPHQGKILRADLGGQNFPEFYFRQLFFNGQRQHLARHPNFDPETPIAGGWTETGHKPEHVSQDIPEDLRKRMFYYSPGAVHDWKHVEDAEVVIFQRARLVPISQAMLAGRWEQLPPDDQLRKSHARYFDTIWFTNTPGARLTFKFRGTAASILCLLGPDTGRVRAIVDGSDQRLRDPVDPWSYYHRLWSFQVAENLPDVVHTVTIELLPEKPDRSTTIEAAKKDNRYRAELFEGTTLRFGFIRLVGELVEE